MLGEACLGGRVWWIVSEQLFPLCPGRFGKMRQTSWPESTQSDSVLILLPQKECQFCQTYHLHSEVFAMSSFSTPQVIIGDCLRVLDMILLYSLTLCVTFLLITLNVLQRGVTTRTYSTDSIQKCYMQKTIWSLPFWLQSYVNIISIFFRNLWNQSFQSKDFCQWKGIFHHFFLSLCVKNCSFAIMVLSKMSFDIGVLTLIPWC